MRIARYLLSGYRPVLICFSLLAVWLLLLANALNDPLAAWRWMDFYNRMELLDVDRAMPAFHDAAVIIYYGDCAKTGGDPYTPEGCAAYWAANPDPHKPWTLYNYPPIWLEVSGFGLTPALTNWAGLAVAPLTILLLAAIFRPRTSVGGLITIATIMSPPVLFGIELANSDLLIFVLLTLSIFATARLGARYQVALRALSIVVLTILKLYPIASVAMLVRGPRDMRFAVPTAIVAGSAAMLAAGSSLLYVFNNTPKYGYPAFGAATAALRASALYQWEFGNWRIYSTILAVVVLALASYYVLRKSKGPWPEFMRPLEAGGPLRDLAICGLATYVLCFFLGFNLNYRLICIVCVVPLFMTAYENKPEKVRLIPIATLVVFLWSTRWGAIYFIDSILSWIIFAVGGASLVASTLFGRPGTGAAIERLKV